MRDYVLPGFIAVLASLFCVWLLYPLAIRVGLVDRPGQRKHHQNEIPLIGGIAIFFGFNFSMLHLHLSLKPFRSLIAGGALLILMGVVDDFHDLSAKLRLLGQVMVAIVLASWGGVMLANLGSLFFSGAVYSGLWAAPLTVFVVVAYLNAFNMIDGQDGLAGTVALGQLLWLFAFSSLLKLPGIQQMLFILIASVLTFLGFNLQTPWRAHAKIFMGDAGSTFIAFLIAWLGIYLSQYNTQLVQPMAILWVVALPIFDLISVILHRIHQGRSVFTPGRDHLHHLLQERGFAKDWSTLCIALLSSAFGGVGFLLNHLKVRGGILFSAFIAALIVYQGVVKLLRQTEPNLTLNLEDEVEQTTG